MKKVRVRDFDPAIDVPLLKKRMRTSMNYNYFVDSRPEKSYLPDMAVPDMDISPAEMLVRYSQNRPITTGHNGMQWVPEEDQLHPGFENMDRVEQAAYLLEHKAHVNELQRSANDKLAARKAAKEQARKQREKAEQIAQQVIDEASKGDAK